MATDPVEIASDLQFLFDREGVPVEIGKKLAEFGITTVAKFSALVKDQEDLREMLKKDFALDSETGGLKVRSTIASILVAWSSAKRRADRKAELDVEHEVRDEPKKLPSGDRHAMKTAFEKQFWKLDDLMCPSRRYLEKKLDEIQKNELRAELLTEVISVKDEGDEVLKPVWDSQMNLKAIRIGQSIPLPANPEQLRKRMNVMGAAWAFVASQHTTRPYLKNVEMRIWTEYCDYLMGAYVMGLMTDSDGGAVSGENWAIILEYDQEIRRAMVKKMQDGKELVSALREAWTDPLVKDRYLITALQKKTLKVKKDWDSEKPLIKKQRRDKGRGQGKDSNKVSRGKGSRSTSFRDISGCADTTPDGKKVCYPFNKRGAGCTRKGCPFAHVCGICFKAGVPMYQCRHGAADGVST